MANKRITRNNTVSWTTNGRWGVSTKTGIVKAFVPRNESASAKMPKRASKGQLVGSDVNTFNDRYLVEVTDPDGRVTYQTPRSITLERQRGDGVKAAAKPVSNGAAKAKTKSKAKAKAVGKKETKKKTAKRATRKKASATPAPQPAA